MIKTPVYRVNLVVITCSWVAAGYTFYILAFYVKEIGGSLFLNTIFSSLSDAVASFVSGFVALKLGAKQTISFSFLLACFFGVLIIFFKGAGIFFMAFFVIGAKFGAASAFNLCYITTNAYFPVKFSSQVFGFVNLVSKSLLTTSSIVSEMAHPYPMVVFCCFCALSFTTISYLRDPPAASQAVSRKHTDAD